MRILVSACLLGVCCRYDGAAKPCQQVMDLAKDHALIPVCPEQLGGLPTPRIPAEIRGEQVVNREGKDVTKAYKKGAEETARLFQLLNCDCAILKARSPSCGCGQVYDGSFSGALVPGDGMTARALKALGVPVTTEEALSGL
ncbi:MAG: DUF523 domain-containing protein [Clostridia bacterium]|nr:DUF523 domain-containing protein [Clostridia bacterium]